MNHLIQIGSLRGLVNHLIQIGSSERVSESLDSDRIFGEG